MEKITNVSKSFKQRVLSRLYGSPDSDSEDENLEQLHDANPDLSAITKTLEAAKNQEVSKNIGPSSIQISYGVATLEATQSSNATDCLSKEIHLLQSTKNASGESSFNGNSKRSNMTDHNNHEGIRAKEQKLNNQVELEEEEVSSNARNPQETRPIVPHASGLTKNQRRKLKKKKRARERQENKSVEFVHEDSVAISNRLEEEKVRQDQVSSIIEFIEGLIDIYKTQEQKNSPETRNQDISPDLLERLQEVFDKDCSEASQDCSEASQDLHLLHTSTKILQLQNKENAVEAVNQLENTSRLDSDLKADIVKLFRFWIARVMDS